MPQVEAVKKPKPKWLPYVVAGLACLAAVGVVVGVVMYLDYRTKLEQKEYQQTLTVSTQLAQQGKHAEAQTLQRRYLSKDRPNDHEYQILVLLGYDLLLTGDRDSAYTMLTRAEALKLNPDDIFFAHSLGYVYEYKGNKDKAAYYYQEAIDRAKRDPSRTNLPFISRFEKDLKRVKEGS